MIVPVFMDNVYKNHTLYLKKEIFAVGFFVNVANLWTKDQFCRS